MEIPKRAFCIDVNANDNPLNDAQPLPKLFINPEITDKSKDVELGWEGCISFPGIIGQVQRHVSIDVTYYDLNKVNEQGELIKMEANSESSSNLTKIIFTLVIILISSTFYLVFLVKPKQK